MAKFEALPTIAIDPMDTMLRTQHLPELVHLTDSALSVMTDFTKIAPHTIRPESTMDEAIYEMKASGVHLLLVINDERHFRGIISSEDVLGEKPIQLLQERRIPRNQILVNMIMVPFSEITAIDMNVIETARVGNIVKTLSEKGQHYALAVSPQSDSAAQIICGIFTTTQISNQLHAEIG